MRFVAAAHVPDVCTDLASRKFLVVGASAGHLAAASLRRRIDDAVEGELATRGALPAAIGVDAELGSCIRDQVFRTRALGTTGLAIALPPLSELADHEGRLNVEDSAALLAWTRATAELPVVLLASEADRTVSAYAPMPLERLLASEGRAAPPAPPPAVDEATWIEASREPASDPFDMTPAPAPVVGPARAVDTRPQHIHMTPAPSAVGPRSRPLTPRPPAVAPRTLDDVLVGAASDTSAREARQSLSVDVHQSVSVDVRTARAAEGRETFGHDGAMASDSGNGDAFAFAAPPQREENAAPQKPRHGILKGTKRRAEMNRDQHARTNEHAQHAQGQHASQGHARGSEHVAHARADHGSQARAGEHAQLEARGQSVILPRPPAAFDPASEEQAEETLGEMAAQAPAARHGRPEESMGETATIAIRARESSAARAVSASEWRNLAMELDAARGPKPVRVIEQLFMTRYVPLVGALARGEADGAVRGVVDGWSQAFEHSYTDAFSAMRVTGKRPMMTFDAPEIATRIARLNGARSVKLLLVDGMSYDLGERVAAELRARSTASGVCVDRLLLWSALPTVTTMQMQLLARGPDALRDVEPSSEPEPEIARGRAISTLRRERLGTREVMKLDLVEARLRTAGAPYEERLDGIADEVAAVLARFLESLPPRTLLFVFGDHGFRLPRSADGRSTGPATQGGASPEEVLVPGYAWLSGGVH